MKKTTISHTIYWQLALAALFLAGCSQLSSSEKEKVAADDPLFQLLSPATTGIDFQNIIQDNLKANINSYDYFYNGGGVAVGDINNDGLPDLFFTGNQVPNRLYLNEGNFKFKDITAQAGIADEQLWSTGVSMVDINNDGWLDIYVCHSGPEALTTDRQNHLFINNQNLTFSEKAKEYGLIENNHSSQAAFFDYDKDGDLDMFLMNHTDFVNRFKHIKHQFKKEEAIKEHLKDPKNRDIAINKLFRNEGNNRFVDVTQAAGLARWGYGLGLGVSDLDKDGWVDIYVANDYHIPDFLFMNNGDGTFKESNKDRMGHNAQFGMGCDVADINNDGWLDIAVVDMTAEDRVRNKTLMSPMDENRFKFVTGNLGYQFQYMFNVLQLNNGNGTFSEIGQLADIAQTDWSWSALLADFDLDADNDFWVTNGFLRDMRNRDISNQINSAKEEREIQGLPPLPLEEQLNLILNRPSVPLVDYIFENTGNYHFAKKAKEWGITETTFSNGAVYADLDQDGDLDLVVNNINKPAFIYQNNAVEQERGHFLQIQLNGKYHNVKLSLSQNGQEQYKELSTTRGYLSTIEPLLHFGFKSNAPIDTLEVEWLSGKVQHLYNIALNQKLVIEEKDATQKTVAPLKPKPLFQYVHSPNLGLQYRHRENQFWDYTKESLLPHRQSRNGPHLSIGDVNGDGFDDLFVGGAKGQSGQLFIQNGEGRFEVLKNAPWTKDKEAEDIGALFFDYDGDEDLDLYVVSGGGGDFAKNAPLLQDRLYENQGNGQFIKTKGQLPKMPESGSRVKATDFDQDGDLDLFVGGRVTPGLYPQTPQSYLLRNEGGRFLDVTNDIAPELSKIGMVTDFVWTDYNNDQQIDLVVVGEWMPITFFKNDNGKFQKDEIAIASTPDISGQAVNRQSSTASTGWWFSIAAEDMDKDGDIDFIVGNLGLNNKFHASPDHPFELYSNDFDDNGTYDIVLAKNQEGKTFPMRGRDCSSGQMPFIKTKFPTYEGFAKATLEEVYEQPKLAEALHFSVTDFSSIYLENKGAEGFVKHPLPIEAQFAPIQDILIKDINKDEHLDVVIAGNLYDTEIETARYDAGTGLYLKGDGKGHFQPVSVEKSGLFLPGNVRDLHWLKWKNRWIIATANNSDILHFYLVR